MWIEGLAAMLLLVALAVALSTRWTRRLWQLALPLAVSSLILLPAATLTWLAGFHKFNQEYRGLLPHDWFVYCLGWSLAFVVGAGVILSRGLKRTSSEQIPAARSWPRGRLALALAGAFILYAITLSNADLEMKMQLSETRREAGAVLVAMKPPTVPDKDNAAPLYEEAFAAITPMESLPARWQGAMKAWQQEAFQYATREVGRRILPFNWKDKDLRAFLSSQERGLALLRRAAAKPGCSFQQYRTSPLTEAEKWFTPPAIRWHYGCQLLSLEAHVKAADGDTQAALDDVKALLAMARHVTLSPASPEDMGLEALVDIMHLARVPIQQLRPLSLDGPDYLHEFPRVEATYALLLLVLLYPEQPRQWHFDWAPSWLYGSVLPLWRVYMGPDDLLFIQRAFRDYQQAHRESSAATPFNWSYLYSSLQNQPGGVWYVRYMKPKIESEARYGCDVTTLRQMVRLVVALAEYKAKHGKYPEQLQALRPDFLDQLPSDPWDGGALRMKRTDKGTMLFTDRNNKGEPLLSPNHRWQRGDIVLWLP